MSESIAGRFAELQHGLAANPSLADALRRVAKLATVSLSGCDHASASIVNNGAVIVSVATTATARHLDVVQDEAGSGPCVDARRNHAIVRVPSTVLDSRWPRYSSEAAATGVVSAMAVPLDVDGTAIGILHMLSTREPGFRARDERGAREFAEHAARLALQLSAALRSRSLIEQAKGILMATEHCSDDAAFAMLVERSQRENRKLRLVAERVVADAQRSVASAGGRAGGRRTDAPERSSRRRDRRSRSGEIAAHLPRTPSDRESSEG